MLLKHESLIIIAVYIVTESSLTPLKSTRSHVTKFMVNTQLVSVNKLALNTRSRIAATVFVRRWQARAFQWERYGSHIGERMT